MQLISPSQGERVSGDEIETFLREDTTRTFHFGSRSRRLNSLENLPDRVRFLRTRINRGKITRFRLGELYFRFVLRNSFFPFFFLKIWVWTLYFLLETVKKQGSEIKLGIRSIRANIYPMRNPFRSIFITHSLSISPPSETFQLRALFPISSTKLLLRSILSIGIEGQRFHSDSSHDSIRDKFSFQEFAKCWKENNDIKGGK